MKTAVIVLLCISSFVYAVDDFNKKVDSLLERRRHELSHVNLTLLEFTMTLSDGVNVTVHNGYMKGLDNLRRVKNVSINETEDFRHHMIPLEATEVTYYVNATVESPRDNYVIRFSGGMSQVEYEIVFATKSGEWHDSYFDVKVVNVLGYYMQHSYSGKVGNIFLSRRIVKTVAMTARQRLSDQMKSALKQVIREEI